MYLREELYDLIKTDKRFFDFIQKNDLDGLWFLDLENPENVWMNDRFLRVLGYNTENTPPTSVNWQNIIKDDLELAIDQFIEHSQNTTPSYDQILRYTHKNGSTLRLRCHGMLIHNKAGKAVRLLGAHENVTLVKSKQIENSLFNLNTVFVVRVDFEGNYKYANKNFIENSAFCMKRMKMVY